MASLPDKIMKRVRGHGRGNWVCTPKDFLDLGGRDAVDQALSRLVRHGKLRRVGRGLYDLPRVSAALKRPVPANVDAVVRALRRKDNIDVMPDGIVAAHGLGLTNAVPAKASYVTNGASRTVAVGRRTIHLRRVPPRVMAWHDRPGAPVVQALRWLGPQLASSPEVVALLSAHLTDDVKKDLQRDIHLLPSWAISIVTEVLSADRVAA